MKNYKLYDMDSVELTECIRNLKLELKKSNTEYKKISEKIEDMKEKFPTIRNFLEDEKSSKLSDEEGKAFLELINLYRKLISVEQYEVFLLGGHECFGYLKRIKVI